MLAPAVGLRMCVACLCILQPSYWMEIVIEAATHSLRTSGPRLTTASRCLVSYAIYGGVQAWPRTATEPAAHPAGRISAAHPDPPTATGRQQQPAAQRRPAPRRRRQSPTRTICTASRTATTVPPSTTGLPRICRRRTEAARTVVSFATRHLPLEETGSRRCTTSNLMPAAASHRATMWHRRASEASVR